jgi:hypothetical protein
MFAAPRVDRPAMSEIHTEFSGVPTAWKNQIPKAAICSFTSTSMEWTRRAPLFAITGTRIVCSFQGETATWSATLHPGIPMRSGFMSQVIAATDDKG